MSVPDRIQYWKVSAARDRKTAEMLYKNGDYHWSLFFWHLVLEKLLKAILLVRQKELIYTHNVLNLARQAEIPISKQFTDQWITICQMYADKWEGLA